MKKPDVNWEDVIGLKKAKQTIQNTIIFPFNKHAFFPLDYPRGILLYGPPGCGNILLATATATEIEAAFYFFDTNDFVENRRWQLLEAARRISENGKPAIIFFDKLDSFIRARSEEVGGEVSANQFLKEIDRINKNKHIYVMGSTDKPWNLNVGLAGRFKKQIYIPLPSLHDRKSILKLYGKKLSNMGPDVDFDELATLTERYSGSDLYGLVQAVHLKAEMGSFELNKPKESKTKLRNINMNDFHTVIKELKPSVSMEMLGIYEEWYEQLKFLE